ncbi:uncharacterized protein LOC119605792 [Lucilia sericata]|uniref:uncharacterized protein LOC119605792 n=1 Tax=Lucilia sericata TaxID=13632 RepID=UPI0018A86CC2|nr:uncharacterized protein LOC119605792 [Lucilia sericata]
MDWTRTEITNLISLYRQYECLWNTSHEDYNNYEVKQNAWQDIAASCDKEVDEVKKKLKNLRSAYVSEKKKSEKSKDHGIDYKPNLFYYHELEFLDTVVILRKSTLSPTATQSVLSMRNKGDNVNIKQRKHKIVKLDRKSLRDTKFNNAIDAILASVKKQQTQSTTNTGDSIEDDNLFNSFGKTTALQLQQLPVDKATETMAAIYQLVAKKTLDSLKKSVENKTNTKRTNGVISFETMSP